MAKVTLAGKMRELRWQVPPHIGPFVTISRQYGCWGFSLGLLMMEILSENAPPGQTWRIYHREILDRLARETDIASDMLDALRRSKPSLIVDFFQAFSPKRIPSGFEIRNRITTIIRGMAIQGHAIIIGQGGAAVTGDLPNGLSVRLEAPLEWRAEQVMFREDITTAQALECLVKKEHERDFLHDLYSRKFPRTPAFDLTFDCSTMTLAQIAQLTVHAMKLRGLV